ncbi:MAG: glycosyltransferase [Candidatus Rokubacteria bacterium]|nr:glycosyltransferase [Candidatus Rokubacteria bacterium]
MIVALVTPYYVPAPRGNAVTAGRVALGLERLGVTVSVVDLSQLSGGGAFQSLAGSAPRIVHAFHAFSGGPSALDYARWKGVPLVVSLTGTDVNHDLSDPGRGITVRKVLEGADALTAFHETVLGKVADVLPGIAAKIRVIPQGVRLGGDAFSLPQLFPSVGERSSFLSRPVSAR